MDDVRRARFFGGSRTLTSSTSVSLPSSMGVASLLKFAGSSLETSEESEESDMETPVRVSEVVANE